MLKVRLWSFEDILKIKKLKFYSFKWYKNIICYFFTVKLVQPSFRLMSALIWHTSCLKWLNEEKECEILSFFSKIQLSNRAVLWCWNFLLIKLQNFKFNSSQKLPQVRNSSNIERAPFSHPKLPTFLAFSLVS